MSQKGLLSNICDLNNIYSKSLNSYAKPILDYFGATHLHFDQLTYEGRLWCLHTHPETLKAYVLDYDGFKTDPMCKDARLIQTNTVVWPFLTHNKSIESLNSGLRENFAIDQGVTFIFFDNKGCYGLAFSGSKENVHLVNMLLKEIKLIKSFKDYLVTELKNIIPDLERNSFDVGKYVGDAFYQSTDFLSSSPQVSKAQVLIQTKQIEESDLKLLDVHLSRRQKQCALLFLKKHTIKEIAQILELSMDTIRRYMFELKERFNIHKKQELFTVLRKLEKLDYFAGQKFWNESE